MTTTMTMRRDVALPHCCDLLNASHCSYVYLTIAFMHCHKSPRTPSRPPRRAASLSRARVTRAPEGEGRERGNETAT
eukprot:COSAG03_NODE_140_length_11772_cov_5.105628_6_plen_77_part_00